LELREGLRVRNEARQVYQVWPSRAIERLLASAAIHMGINKLRLEEDIACSSVDIVAVDVVRLGKFIVAPADDLIRGGSPREKGRSAEEVGADVHLRADAGERDRTRGTGEPDADQATDQKESRLHYVSSK